MHCLERKVGRAEPADTPSQEKWETGSGSPQAFAAFALITKASSGVFECDFFDVGRQNRRFLLCFL